MNIAGWFVEGIGWLGFLVFVLASAWSWAQFQTTEELPSTSFAAQMKMMTIMAFAAPAFSALLVVAAGRALRALGAMAENQRESVRQLGCIRRSLERLERPTDD